MDMYFLFDLSGTMKDVLGTLTEVAKDLANELSELTTDR